MDSLPVQHHNYIKQNDTVAEQREGLNMLLMMSPRLFIEEAGSKAGTDSCFSRPESSQAQF